MALNRLKLPTVTPAFFEGFNATILAYGQTGSGKTYTMGSASSLRISEDEQGIIPRVITGMYDLLREASDESPHVSYTVRCQFLEIYGEDIHDLLEPAGSTVTIREGQNGEVNVHGAKEMRVNNAEEMAMLLERGSLCRTTGSTLMNAHSSRSHAIFTVLLEQRIRAEGISPVADDKTDPDDVEIRRSKFHFVDLAGSERAKRTGASGQRFKEGVDINKGLLTLGNVISALGDDSKRGRVHVPYRDSKLTRMLQDSLGGNSQTLMICCVSPAESNLHESLSALRYANRARNIKNKPVVNRDANSIVIHELREKVQALASELLRIRSGGAVGDGDGSSDGVEGSVSSATLRELAVASTPSRQPPKLFARASSARLGSSDMPAPVQRELTLLRARVAEAEGEVQRLTEEAKRARKRESAKDDTLAEMKAELDLARVNIAARGEGASNDMLMLDIAEAATAGAGASERPDPSGESRGTSRGSISQVIKGFLSGSGSMGTMRSSDGGNDEAAQAIATVDGGGGSSGGGQDPGRTETRQRALAVVKNFHKQIQGLEDKLGESERQRVALERQLVQHAGGGEGSGDDGNGGTRAVGLSAKLAAAADGHTDPVAEAEKRLAQEKRRKEELIARLGAGVDTGSGSDGKSDSSSGGNIVRVEGQDSDSADDSESDSDDEEGEVDDELGEGDNEPGKAARRLDAVSKTRSSRDKEEQALRKSETKINSELSDLDRSIMDKEALLAQIKQGQASYETMQQHYEHKLREMDMEVQRHEQEHERLLADLEKLEKQTEVAVQEEREKLKKKLKERTEALREAKERQSELGTLARVRGKKDEDVRTLENEIVKMKRDKVELQRRLGLEQKRQREILIQKSKEITSLKKSAAKDQAEVKRLQHAKNKAEAVSKRHLDELAFIRRLQRQKLGVGRKQKLTVQEKETKRLLETKLKELTRAEEAAERLSAEYEKKLLLLQQKESLELVKVSITSRRDSRQVRVRDASTRARASPFGARENRSGDHSPRSRLRAKKHHSAKPQAAEQAHRSGGVCVAGDGASTNPAAAAETAGMTLRAALPAEGGLDQEELDTLREVEERLESNKAQLEYKERKIVSIQREVDAWAQKRRLRQRGTDGGRVVQDAQGQPQYEQGKGQRDRDAARAEVGEAQMIEELESGLSDLKGAKGIIRVLFSSLVAARRGLKQKTGAAKALQEQLEKKSMALEDTQELRQAEQRSYDRKVTALTTEHERKINGFLNHTALSDLLHESIERTKDNPDEASSGDTPAAEAGSSPTSGTTTSGAEEGALRPRRGVGGADSTTQDMMAKVLHERYLSEREKVRTLHSRLKESEARIGDLEEVRKNEQKAFAEKQHDEEWLTYELKVYRTRCSQLRDERDHLKSELERALRNIGGDCSVGGVGNSGDSGEGGGLGGTQHSTTLEPGSGASSLLPPPPAQPLSPSRSRPPSGASPSRRNETEVVTPEMASERERRWKALPGSGGRGVSSPPENAASEVGSEYDDDFADEHDSEGGDVNFAGVTNDLEAIREGKMPESMQLVARVNAEAGGKVSVFDRLASTTTESRRQKVNDRDQLQENLRRKAKQDALRKKKDFKVLPGHLSPSVNTQPQGTGQSGHSASASTSEPTSSLEGGRNTGAGSDAGRYAHTHTHPTGSSSNSRVSLDNGAEGGRELSVFERLQAPTRRSSEDDNTPPRTATITTRSKSPMFNKVHSNHGSKGGGPAHKKYVKMGGGPAVPSSRAFAHSEHLLARGEQAEASRGGANSSSPSRATTTEDKERSVNADEATEMSREGATHTRGGSSGVVAASGVGDVFERLPYTFTESERKRRQPEAMSTGSRQAFITRRSSHDREAAALSAALGATGATSSTSVPLVSSRRSVEMDAGGSRSDDRSGRW